MSCVPLSMIWVLFGPNFPKLCQCPKYLKNENQRSRETVGQWRSIGVEPLTLLTNWESQVFLINRNSTVKLSLINIIHVKQHNVGFFIFKFTPKYMLGDVYIYVYILGKDLQILCCIQRNHSCLFSKQLGRMVQIVKITPPQIPLPHNNFPPSIIPWHSKNQPQTWYYKKL